MKQIKNSRMVINYPMLCEELDHSSMAQIGEPLRCNEQFFKSLFVFYDVLCGFIQKWSDFCVDVEMRFDLDVLTAPA